MDKLLLILVIPLQYLFIYWIHCKLKSSKKEKQENGRKSFFLIFKDYIYTPFLIIVVLSYAFLSENVFLQEFVIPVDITIKLIGFVMYVLGFVLKFWAYYCLGSNWSSKIAIYKEHKLVNFGPYRYVRHSVYISYMVTFFGLALYCGNLLLFALSVIYSVMNIFRAKQEDVLLSQKFGPSFTEYITSTGAFVPKPIIRLISTTILVLFIIINIIGMCLEALFLITGNCIL